MVRNSSRSATGKVIQSWVNTVNEGKEALIRRRSTRLDEVAGQRGLGAVGVLVVRQSGKRMDTAVRKGSLQRWTWIFHQGEWDDRGGVCSNCNATETGGQLLPATPGKAGKSNLSRHTYQLQCEVGRQAPLLTRDEEGATGDNTFPPYRTGQAHHRSHVHP